MFSWLKRLRVGSAHRNARGFAGGVAGVEFGLFMMMKPNFKGFLGGLGIGAAAMATYAVEMVYQGWKNYQDSDPLSWSNQNRKQEEKATTQFVLQQFSEPANEAAVESFLNTTLGEKKALNLKEAILSDNDDRRYEALCQIFRVVHSDFSKYPHMFVASTFCFFGHLVEMNLTQFAHNPKLFDFNEGGLDNNSNIGLIAVMVFALWQSLITFKEVKESYEIPASPYALKQDVMNAFTKYKRQLDAKPQTPPEDSKSNNLSESFLPKGVP